MPRLTLTLSIHKNSGFTMIEVLITIIVVSIGLLGLAGLQISGLRANMNSEERSKASILANDIAERMHANPLGVDNPTVDANNISNDNGYASISMSASNCTNNQPAAICSNYTKYTSTTATNGSTTTTTSTINAADCTPKEMAMFDVWEWACGMPTANNVVPGGLTNILVNGTGSISCDDNDTTDTDACSPGSPHTIAITWDVLNPDDYGVAGTGNTQTQSYSLVVVP